MDKGRSVRRAEGPRAPGEPSIKEAIREEGARSRAHTGNGEVMRDRVTGVGTRHRQPVDMPKGASSGEIEQELRRTRARISATLDDIEHRLSPAHLKEELTHTVQDTINDLREEYSPTKMARQAGDTVMDTIKDHPIAAAAAGASIGYLIMKGVEGDDRGKYPNREAYPYYEGPYTQSWEERSGQSWDEHSGEGRFEGARHRADDARKELRHKAEEAGREVRHQAEEIGHQARDVQHRVQDASREAVHRSREVAHRAGVQARRTGRRIEDFVYDNPFAAGAIAIGIGAIVGGLFPASDIENRYLGPARDEALERARDVADDTMDRAKEAGKHVADEAKDAAKDVASTAKSEAKSVGQAARDSAQSQKEQGSTAANRPAQASDRDSRGTSREDVLGGTTESGSTKL